MPCGNVFASRECFHGLNWLMAAKHFGNPEYRPQIQPRKENRKKRAESKSIDSLASKIPVSAINGEHPGMSQPRQTVVGIFSP